MEKPHIADNAILDRAVLQQSVTCRRCGYNLRSLNLGGRCPECGLYVVDTIVSVIDPAASRLPRLRHPMRVGNALVWILGCMLLALILQLARPVAMALDQLKAGGQNTFSQFTAPSLTWIAGGLLIIGIWGVYRLAPPLRAETRITIWRDLVLMASGLGVWGVLSLVAGFRPTFGPDAGDETATILLIKAASHLIAVLGMLMVLMGLRGVLAVIGDRSREYRSAKGGRQRIRDMIAAVIVIVVTQLLKIVNISLEWQGLGVMATIVMWITTLMIVIGLGYLLMNAWWIRTSLRKPPPRLVDLLAEERRRGIEPTAAEKANQ